MFFDIGNWNGIFLAILSVFLFLLGLIAAADIEDVPRDDNPHVSKESWEKARKQMRAKPW